MTPGDHAADDGSFARSASVHAGRAAILIFVALIIGFLVLDQDSVPSRSASPPPDAGDVNIPETTSTTLSRPTTTLAATRPPDQVKVIALNGTNTSGVAKKVSDQLVAAKYNVLAATNATATAKAQVKSSVVYYAAGYNKEALAVATVLGLAPTAVLPLPNPPPATDANVRNANVVVMVKEDLANRPAASSTTTTRRP